VPELAPTSFLDDWTRELRRCLREHGVRDADALEGRTVDLLYFAWLLRRIEDRPRRVREAQGLIVPDQHATGYAHMVAAANAGGPLWPYQSRRLKRAESHDGMFNDWAIHHFHLGATLKGDGYVSRTKEVVLAIVGPDDLLVLDIRPHGSGHELLWVEEDLLEIVLENWPGLFRGLSLSVSGSELTRAQRRKLRGAGLNATVTLSNGKTYGPPGGGQAASGISVRAVQLGDRWAEAVEIVEAGVREQFASFVVEAKRHGVDVPDRAHLDLQVRPDGVFAVLRGAEHVRWPLLEPPGPQRPVERIGDFASRLAAERELET